MMFEKTRKKSDVYKINNPSNDKLTTHDLLSDIKQCDELTGADCVHILREVRSPHVDSVLTP